MTTIIVGAGASGLACAVRLKQNNRSMQVIVLERLERIGKKLLATGNGRCNLSNSNAHHSDEVLQFFLSIGLLTKEEDDGRIYPYSNQASTVLELLEKSCRDLGVEIITDCTVNSIDSDLTVSTDCGIFMADALVIAAGGQAQKNLGSNASGYKLLKSVGHKITPLYPSLVQLTSSSKYPSIMKGQRAKCNMTILLDGKDVKSEYGEVLFTDYGLSGIVSMNLSYIVSKNFADSSPKKCHAVLDLTPDISSEQLSEHIKKFGDLSGILGGRLARIIDKQAQGDIQKAVNFTKHWKLIITGTKGYDFAQITYGGASLDEFDCFESKKVKGLYACGEVLDRQFPCGGYNLNFAFYSGIKVADCIANSNG
ncbi:MAG: aminoacetone oxidase family FAD-binding enzyme [Clostridiales bacterium]|nr:aminoacetone oxidase family FAD-binding enzyme [Clostridiales bacterium]